MRFSVVFIVDTLNDIQAELFDPKKRLGHSFWVRTEIDAHTVYRTLGFPFKEGGHHGKWVAILNKQELGRFIRVMGLKVSKSPMVEVYGSPAFHGGTCNSVLMSNEGRGALLNALVTPYCEWKERHTDRDWNRLERAFRNTYNKEGERNGD